MQEAEEVALSGMSAETEAERQASRESVSRSSVNAFPAHLDRATWKRHTCLVLPSQAFRVNWVGTLRRDGEECSINAGSASLIASYRHRLLSWLPSIAALEPESLQ